MNWLGKRFFFSAIAIICVSVVTSYLKYGGEIYLKLVGAITLVYVAGQSITDLKK